MVGKMGFMKSGAQEVVRVLKEANVEVVFGIPSVHSISLYEALRREPSIRHILCRQETMAAHMADGYARAGHRLGVVLSSTGPGAAYTVPAIQEAWGSCSPVLMIATNIPCSKIGRGFGALHEIENQDSLFRSITKAALLVRSGKTIRDMTQQAVDIALSGRPGPVYLEIPTDLLGKPLTQGNVTAMQKPHNTISEYDLEKAVSMIRKAKRPLLIAGTGVVRADMAGDVLTLAEMLTAPVITTTNGKGVIPEDHFLAAGNAARRGATLEMIRQCDLAIAIGTRLREVDAKRRGLSLPPLIHVDWDNEWVNKNFPAEIALTGSIPFIVKALLERLGLDTAPEQRVAWMRAIREKMELETKNIRQAHLEMGYLEAIRKALPREGVLVIDNTHLGYWAEYFYPSYCTGGLMAARGSTTIGFAFAAAMGAKIACPEKPVLALIGDGGFLYGAQELATCVRHKMGIPVIVANDNAYGTIAYLQRSAYKVEYESQLTNPNFVALARAYGVQAARVDSPAALEKHLEKALQSNDMWVIELTASFSEPPFARY
jgi:thiamine pyrophosphate-dependent acetolactate synthase large subunit-like protein